MGLVMAVLIRGLWTFAAVVLTAAVLVIGGGAALTTNQPTVPTLYFMYAMNCTFTIQNDAGATVSQIPPGTYQVDIRTPLAFGTVPLAGVTDLTACRGAPQFQLTGPGVNIFTTMTAGCEADKTFPATFQAGQSYTAQDLNQPSVTRTVFSIATSGSATVPPPIIGTGKGSVEDPLVGSGVSKATLTATLSAKGALTLTNKGKPITSLPAGRYSFTLLDKDPKAGLTILGPSSKAPINLTGVKFVGKKTRALMLGAGRWSYYAGPRNFHYIVVSGSPAA